MRVHLRVTPGAVRLVIETSGMSLPSTLFRTLAAACDVMQWAHGYSGCIGVSPSGTHDASRGVALLPVRSALRTAVIGRQKLKAYLASNTAMKASLVASATRANSRALSVRSSCFRLTSWRRRGFHVCGPVTNQKRPMSVCSFVRLVLVWLPSSRIWLKSSVQVVESRVGGGAGRNCDPLSITHGFTPPKFELTGITVGTYWPGAV